jgi:hypothetical protein
MFSLQEHKGLGGLPQGGRQQQSASNDQSVLLQFMAKSGALGCSVDELAPNPLGLGEPIVADEVCKLLERDRARRIKARSSRLGIASGCKPLCSFDGLSSSVRSLFI